MHNLNTISQRNKTNQVSRDTPAILLSTGASIPNQHNTVFSI